MTEVERLKLDLIEMKAQRDDLEADLMEVAGVLMEAAEAVNIEKIMNAKNPQVALTTEVLELFSPSPFQRKKKPLMERFAFFAKLGPLYEKHKNKFNLEEL